LTAARRVLYWTDARKIGRSPVGQGSWPCNPMWLTTEQPPRSRRICLEDQTVNRLILLFTTSLSVLTALGSGQVIAQSPIARPPVSPYLNLLRQGSSSANNYYNRVRPQVDFRSSLQQLQQQAVTQQTAGVAEQAGLPVTGHRSSFFSEGRYYLNNFSGGVGGGGGVAGFGLPAGGARSAVAQPSAAAPRSR